MSTEYSASPGMVASTTASIVEVEAATTLVVEQNEAENAENLFKLKSPPNSLEVETDDDDKMMMTEYDEDNVIVIDLSEERNASAKNIPPFEVQPPLHMFASPDWNEGTKINFLMDGSFGPKSCFDHLILCNIPFEVVTKSILNWTI